MRSDHHRLNAICTAVLITDTGRLDLAALREAELKRAAEREAVRKLKLQMIDAGYKALATKLHPGGGGSPEAMARLNEARDQLKATLRKARRYARKVTPGVKARSVVT